MLVPLESPNNSKPPQPADNQELKAGLESRLDTIFIAFERNLFADPHDPESLLSEAAEIFFALEYL